MFAPGNYVPQMALPDLTFVRTFMACFLSLISSGFAARLRLTLVQGGRQSEKGSGPAQRIS